MLISVSARSEIFLYENFNYPDGPIVGAEGSPWQTHSGGGTGEEALVVSGRLQTTFSHTEDINASLPGAPFSGSDPSSLFASFSVKFTALPTSAGNYFAHFNSSSFRAAVWAMTSGAPSGSFRLAIGNTSSGATVSLTNNLVLNQNYFVVIRYNLSEGLSTIWLNPDAETDESATASESASPTSISAFAFRQASGTGTILIDDLKIGTSFSDVVLGNAVLAPQIVAAPQNQNVFEGAEVQFYVKAGGPAPFEYQWQFNGTNLPNANDAILSLTNVTSANAGDYSVVISNNAGSTNSPAARLTVKPPPPVALSILTYNTHGNDVEDWSTNSPQIQAIGRQVIYLNPDVITFQEIPYTNTYQMTNFVKAFLPGYFLATNSVTDGAIRSVIASRFPITRSKSWLPHADLAPFGYTNSNFTRDLFEAEINVPGFLRPVHVFTTHLKAGASSSDDSAKRAAEASAISNFFVTSFLTTNADHPYLVTGDFNEDVARPSTGSQQPLQRMANAQTGLQPTFPLNPVTLSEMTYSIQASDLTRRYDYILPCDLLFSNVVDSQVFRTDLLDPVPPGIQTNDDKVASDHLPVLMLFANPYEMPFQITSVIASNQLLTLNWESESGRAYALDVSTNLNGWIPLATNLMASGTNVSFSTNLSDGAMFFRVRRNE